MKLVIYPPVESDRLLKIQDATGAMQIVNASDENAAFGAMADADAFFGKITPTLLKRAAKLRWVQSPTASLEHYIFPELAEHPCILTNMRGLFSDVIADQVMGYVICFARNLHLYIRKQVQSKWEPEGGETARVSFTAGPGVINDIDRAHWHLADTTMGIVGFGAIGAEIARRASAFGMTIVAVDPLPKDVPDYVEAVWPVDQLGDLLKRSDFVVVAAPHTPDTVKLFRSVQFKQMKPTSYFINIGRGAIVDLADLVEALETKIIAGIALDVFEIEPLPAEHPLWKSPNAILTPHVAGYSPRIAQRHLALFLDNLHRFVRGDELRNVVNKSKWF